jgi:hypothetical protein
MAATQQPRRGYLTTEFYVTIAVDVGVLAAALAGSLPPKYAAYATSISTVAYALSRGLAKVKVP